MPGRNREIKAAFPFNSINRMQTNIQLLDQVLNGLITRYRQRVPVVGEIIRLMEAEQIIGSEKELENDHIAFRTLGVPNLGIQSFEKIFLHYGYQKRDPYFFPEKKLDAWWYEPPVAGYPRIFASELRVKDLSARAREIIHSYTGGITRDPVDALDLSDAGKVDEFLHSSLWKLPSLEDYQFLSSESEYAAWVIYNRYYLNHFTISVHNLRAGYNTIESFTAFLEKHGVILNDAGGKIKVSPDKLLLQSSTVAAMVDAAFANGVHFKIPGSYIEFAERRLSPTGTRREGFEAANADKIFESTYQAQVSKQGDIS